MVSDRLHQADLPLARRSAKGRCCGDGSELPLAGLRQPGVTIKKPSLALGGGRVF